MGLLNLFKKEKNSNNKKINVSTEFIDKPIQYLTKNPKKLNSVVSKNGLAFEEILLLSYAEKYLSGKTIARFWQYDYNILDVMSVIKSLEKRGFITDGKLTELGNMELSENEYVLYLHRHKKWCLDNEKIMKSASENPKHWRDIIWAEFNRLYLECSDANISKKRFIKQSMYEFVLEEKNYSAAFNCLAEVFFIDLNGYGIPEHDPSLAIAPGLKYGFKELVKNLEMDDHQMVDRLMLLFDGMPSAYYNYSNQEIAFIVTAITFDMEEIADKIFEKKIKK